MRLLMAKSVHEDLRVTEAQLKKIDEFVEFSRERARQFAAIWPDLSPSRELPEARKRAIAEWTANSQSRQRELVGEIIGQLTPSQAERLKQIELQQAMDATLVTPKFIDELEMTGEQLARIRLLSERVRESQSPMFHELDALTTVEERLKKFMELARERDKVQAEANRRAMDVLKPAQRAKLEDLVGRVIEVTWDYDVHGTSDKE